VYDLVLKGGTVLDPSQGLNEKMDVAVTGDRISLVAPLISRTEGARVVEALGKYVTPGLIDIHAHVYDAGRSVNHPDTAGVRSGVTTVVDAGSAGPANFQDFCDFVMPQAKTRVYCLLNIFRDRTNPLDTKESDIDVDEVVRVAQEHPDIVKGVKVLVYTRMVHLMGLKHLEAAKDAARQVGLPVMMHMGDIGPKDQPPTPTEVIGRALSILDAGDIVTHLFTPLTGAALDPEGGLLPEIRDAQDRGVLFDTSYGDFNFGWERAERVLAQGIIPDMIGTDIEVHPGAGYRTVSTRGLMEYASFFLELGFSLEDIVRMSTLSPSKAIDIEDRSGSLAVGREADLSVFEVVEGQWDLSDATGVSRTGTRALVPILTVREGQIIEPGEAPHSWGWGPPPAETPARAGV